MKHIKALIVGFIIIAMIVSIGYMIISSSETLIGIGLLIIIVIGIVSLTLLAFFIGTLIMESWGKIRGGY